MIDIDDAAETLVDLVRRERKDNARFHNRLK